MSETRIALALELVAESQEDEEEYFGCTCDWCLGYGDDDDEEDDD